MCRVRVKFKFSKKMAPTKDCLGSASGPDSRQPWYQKWWNKMRSGRKKSPNRADPKTPGKQGVDHQNMPTRVHQLDNNQYTWYWHQQNWNEQLSSSSHPLPALSNTEPNQLKTLEKNSTELSGDSGTVGIQQPNVDDRDKVPDSQVLLPSQVFKENTGPDVNWMPDASGNSDNSTDYLSPETYMDTDFCSDVYCSDSFASME